MTDSQRNLLILLAVAVAGAVFSGAFGGGALIASILLNVAFTVLLLAAGVLWYQRNSGTIDRLPSTQRWVMRGAALVLLVTLTTGMLTIGTLLPWPFGWSNTAPLLFWGLVLACAGAIWWAWQHRTSRW